jgi:hypothetical protein
MATPSREMTTLTLRLRTESTEKLKQRAAASGQGVGEFVSNLVEHFAESPTPIETLSGDIGQRFLESGMTETELAEELNRAKHEMRAERRRRNAS